MQPNSSSVALNRVLGADPSSIMGSLSANGKVFLVNPNGILFGKGAQVNVAGLVASTRNITDSDFMAGNYKFAGAGNGAILNQGSINADGGYVALLGAKVSNEGVISARLGTVALAAGNAFTLDVAGDGLLNVAVNQGAVNALVQNGGLIRADGGQVLLTAQAAGNLLQSVVNNTGVIQAQTVENRNGTIRLLADMQSGTVNVGGTLDASGMGAGQTGGSVTVTGHHVGLFGGHINAAGDAGGGTVLVGGDFQGKNVNVQSASATYMSADSTISADAITNGSGGTVVLWANDSTRAYGGITARGGAQGGDGGLIETSGHWLDVSGIIVNASAPNGKPGMWLLDPADVTITNVGGTTNGSFNGGNPDVFTPAPGAATATVDVATIVGDAATGLTGGTDITINTTNNGIGNGDITVASPITWVRITPGPASTLTLNAVRDVNINATITTDFGNLVVCCGQDIRVSAAITTTDGSVLLSAGRDIFMNAAMTTTRGNITLCAGHDVNVTGKIVLTDFANFQGFAAARNTGLGLADGLVLSAGNAATGPGAAGGTVFIAPRADPAEITRAPVTIIYNPTSYQAGGQTDYSTGVFFANPGDPHIQFMLVFPGVLDKTFDGSTTATLAGFKSTALSGPVPGTVTLVGPGSATFDTQDVGLNKTVTFSGFSLAQDPIVNGGNGLNFALPVACCAPLVGRTTGNVIPVPVVVAPGVEPPVIVVAPADSVPAVVSSLPYVQHSVGSAIPLELAGLSLSVLGGGITMPPLQFAAAPPPAETGAASSEREMLPVQPSPVVVPPATPPVYIPPQRPRIPDRN